MNTYGYATKKEELSKRLSRAEGQVRGIAKMVNEDKYCIDILTQITAIQAALDKVGLQLLNEHTKHCLADPGLSQKGRQEKAEEMVKAVSRMIAR